MIRVADQRSTLTSKVSSITGGLNLHRLPAVLWRLVALVGVALLVTLLPPGLPARPELVVLVVGAAALRHGPVTGALVGLAGGWILDLIPPLGEPIGATALVMAAAGGLMGWASRWARLSVVLPWLIVIAGAVLVQAARVVTALAQGDGAAIDLGGVAWTSGVTAIFAVVLLPLLTQVERALELRGWS